MKSVSFSYDTYCSGCGTFGKCRPISVYDPKPGQPPLAFLCESCWKRGEDAGLIEPPKNKRN